MNKITLKKGHKLEDSINAVRTSDFDNALRFRKEGDPLKVTSFDFSYLMNDMTDMESKVGRTSFKFISEDLQIKIGEKLGEILELVKQGKEELEKEFKEL